MMIFFNKKMLLKCIKRVSETKEMMEIKGMYAMNFPISTRKKMQQIYVKVAHFQENFDVCTRFI